MPEGLRFTWLSYCSRDVPLATFSNANHRLEATWIEIVSGKITGFIICPKDHASHTRPAVQVCRAIAHMIVNSALSIIRRGIRP